MSAAIRNKAWAGAASLALVLAASPAHAATRCVSKTLASCVPLIQTAVTAAQPLDTVLIYPGTYNESVVEAGSKDGLRITGYGVVVIDTEAQQPGNSATGITINSNNVSLTNLTVRNGLLDGIVVYGSGFTMTSVSVISPAGDCVVLAGSGPATVKLSKLRGCGGNGIRIGSSGAKLNTASVISTTIAEIGDNGISAWGDNLLVTATTIFGTYNYSIRLHNGTGAQIKSNTLRDNYYDAVRMGNYPFLEAGSGPVDNAVISYNRIYAPDGDGLDIRNGANLTVSYNTILGAYGNGIYLCPGKGAKVTFNTITGPGSEAIYLDSCHDGVSVTTYSDNATVSYNRISGNAAYDAIEIYGSSATVNNNIINTSYAGVYIEGGGTHTANSNVVTNGNGTGVDIECTSCTAGPTVKYNRVTEAAAGEYGVYVDSDASGGTVANNVVTRATYEGFRVYGTGMAITANLSIDSGFLSYSFTYGTGYGFAINGMNHTITSNISRGSGGDGFHVSGSGHTLTLNTADHSGEDGFDIHATGVALTGNKALYTAGTAFEIDSSATGITSVSGNLVLYGNAVGLCNAGGATIGTNSFGPTIANPPSSGQCNEASGYIGD